MTDETRYGGLAGQANDPQLNDPRLAGTGGGSEQVQLQASAVAAHQQGARRLVRAAYAGPSCPRDEPNADGFHPIQNVGQAERWGSVVGGAALVWAGLRTGRLNGLILGAMGAGLMYRGVTGHCTAYEALGIDSAEHSEATAIPAQQGVKVEHTVQVYKSHKSCTRSGASWTTYRP